MNLELYEYGLSCVIDDIKRALENALDTKDKSEKAKYIGEAYGMVAALGTLIIEKENEENETITT